MEVRARTAGPSLWPLVVFAVIIYGITLVLAAGRAHGSIGGDDPIADAVFGLVWLLFIATGAIIVSRDPGNRVGWAFVASGFLQILYSFTTEYAAHALIAPAGQLPFADVAAWGHYNLGVIGTTVVPFMLLWFPTGRPPSRRWRPVEWLAWACAGALTVTAVWTWPHRGPAMMALSPPSYPSDDLALAGLMGSSAAMAAGGASLVARFVGSRGIERQQLKLMAFAASLVTAVIVLDVAGALHESTATIVDVLAALTFAGVPVAAGVAMLRYRLFDVDRVISRTVSYALVLGTLGALYAGGVLTLGSAARWLGPGMSNDLAVAAATLLAAAAFRPLRRRVGATVDRRFNRARYDAEQVVGAFGRHLRDEVELSVIDDQLRAAVVSTVQPAGVSVWLTTALGSAGRAGT